MGRVFVPENFDQPGPVAAAPPDIDPRESEAERLGTFERGYQAGWDDSVAALSAERKAISADFAANLADLSFTYHEARGHVLRQLEDLVVATFARLLPDCARASLPHTVWAQIQHLAAASADAPVTVLVAPGAGDLLEGLLPSEPGLPVSVVEEPTLTDGQVFIRSQKGEVAVDHAAALNDIEAAVRQFFAANARDEEGMKAHG